MTTAPYQLLPPLTAAELQELAVSINEHGVMVPVLVDEDGVVIDGHHRQRIADDFGIDYPVVQRSDLSDADKRTLALSLNLHRRHLTREQKREVIAASLTADPELSNRQHAERTGADHKTVGSVRDDLVSRGEIPHVENRTDSLGRSAPATKPAPPTPEPAPDAQQIDCLECGSTDLVMTTGGWACPTCDEVEPESADEAEAIDSDEWEPGGWKPTPTPKPAPLTREQQREIDLEESCHRDARAVTAIVERWAVVDALANGRHPRRERVLELLAAPTRESFARIEEALRVH